MISKSCILGILVFEPIFSPLVTGVFGVVTPSLLSDELLPLRLFPPRSIAEKSDINFLPPFGGGGGMSESIDASERKYEVNKKLRMNNSNQNYRLTIENFY
jgi:hypothetical protein